ncbi:hypothetical protein KL864_35460, partial [Mycolicibacterium goodii]|uniref:hypothetical protein n=1 Tax=Mycolicibacterium goodii TaxID=134601 RepID=UPI001BDDC92F
MHGSVEKQFIHTALLGESIAPFRLLDPFETVVPVANGSLLKQSDIDKNPGLAQWWNAVNTEWDEHKTGQNRAKAVSLTQQADHMGKLTSLDLSPAARLRLFVVAGVGLWWWAAWGSGVAFSPVLLGPWS